MESHHPPVVGVWTPEAQPKIGLRNAPRASLRVPPVAVGIVSTLLLHLFVFQSFVALGANTRNAHLSAPRAPGSFTSLNENITDQTLVLLQPIATVSTLAARFEDIASLRPSAHNHPVSNIKPDFTRPAFVLNTGILDDPIPEEAVSSVDLAGHARLTDIYFSQVHARIERFWNRPRAPVSALGDSKNAEDTFRCDVRIVQDAHGGVLEILLSRCNGSAAWQSSLVMAINEASPLPAPPDPSVFAYTLTLEFSASPFRPTGSADDYETVSP
jgi:hypothetical protein